MGGGGIPQVDPAIAPISRQQSRLPGNRGLVSLGIGLGDGGHPALLVGVIQAIAQFQIDQGIADSQPFIGFPVIKLPTPCAIDLRMGVAHHSSIGGIQLMQYPPFPPFVCGGNAALDHAD